MAVANAPSSQAQTPPKQMVINQGPDKRERDERNLYSAPWLSIIMRNFVAGAFRALGAIILYIAFLALMGWFANQYILPEVRPLFKAVEDLSKIQQQGSGGQIKIDPSMVQQFLKQSDQESPQN